MILDRPQTRPVTLDQFETYIALPENADRRFELIHGEIVEKMPTFKHGMYALNIASPIKIYFASNPIGKISVEARHRPPNTISNENDRLPDVSVVCDLTREIPDKGAVLFMPDLAVEIKSPDDSIRAMREKARFYLANGCRLVWLVISEKRIIEVYTPDDEYFLIEGDMLSGGDVLPGFELAVTDVFAV
jgi:Uma2 family endonuclease